MGAGFWFRRFVGFCGPLDSIGGQGPLSCQARASQLFQSYQGLMEIDGRLEGVALYRQTVPPRIHQFKIGIQALPITSVNAVKRSARGRQCLTRSEEHTSE